MDPINAFCELVHRQRSFLECCLEFDEYYINQSRDKWKPRFGNKRGWTQNDLNRREFMLLLDSSLDVANPIPSTFSIPKFDKPTDTRVRTAFRVFRLFDDIDRAYKSAIEFCRTNPEYSIHEPAAIHRVKRLHFDWLRFFRDEEIELLHENQEEQLRATSELERLARSINHNSSDDNPTELPLVDLETATLNYKGKTFADLTYDTLQLFDLLVRQHPRVVSVNQHLPDIRISRIKEKLEANQRTRCLANLIVSGRGKAGTSLNIP